MGQLQMMDYPLSSVIDELVIMPPASCLDSFIPILATVINMTESSWWNCIPPLFLCWTSEELGDRVESLLPPLSS